MAAVDEKLDLNRVTEQYFAAWEARDPDRIVALHTDDTRFEIHTNGEPVVGRDAVRATFAGLFEQWPGFRFESHRVLLGDRHWVLDWTLISDTGASGEVRFDCLDVVEVSADGLVARKDTFIDAAQLQAAMAAS